MTLTLPPPDRPTLLVYRLASATNILGVSFLAQAFYNEALFKADPLRFSWFGVLMLMVWGVAYLAASRAASLFPELSYAFALEKSVYIISWVSWVSAEGHTLGPLFEQNILAGLFYSIYGVVDLIFLILFLWCGARARKNGFGVAREEAQ